MRKKRTTVPRVSALGPSSSWGSSLKLYSDTGGNRTRKATHFVTGMYSVTMKRLAYFVRFVCSCSHLHCLRSNSITIDSYINMFHLLVTRKSYFIGLKISAWKKLGIFFQAKQKMYSQQVRFNPSKLRYNQESESLEKLKFSSSSGGDIWWPSLISYHIVSHLGWQPLPERTKMAAMTLLLKIETCNINQTPLSLGQSSISAAITRNDKNNHKGYTITRNDKNVHNGNKNQLSLNFGQSSKSMLWVTLNCSHYQKK